MSESPWSRFHDEHPKTKPQPVGTAGELLILALLALCAGLFFAWQVILPVIGLLWLGGAI